MTETDLKNFLENEFETSASGNCTNLTNAIWDSLTDLLNPSKLQQFQQAVVTHATFKKDYFQNYFANLNPLNYKDEKIKWQITKLQHYLQDNTNNGSSSQDLWSYEIGNLNQEIDKLWNQVKPLLMAIHQYIDTKVGKISFNRTINANTPPIFLNLRAQDVINLAEMATPFPDASKLDITAALNDQKYTILKMYQTADEFYKSMGLLPSNMAYDVGKGAIIEEPTSANKMACDATAWDFCDRKTFRIKMCTKIDSEDFITIHHEMGHIQYFLQYSKQPYIFRSGANPGFHEAISATIALSAATPKHLKKINLLKHYEESRETSINFLMDMAIQKVAFLPFSATLDDWPSNILHSGRFDFDPSGGFSIIEDSPHVAHFVSRILQFQIYKSFCITAGEYDPKNKKVPLHQCDFYQSKEVGKKLSDGLALGSSERWRDVLEKMTGEREMDGSALLEYFEPLDKFLAEENSKSDKNNVGTMGSTIHFVFLMEICVFMCGT